MRNKIIHRTTYHQNYHNHHHHHHLTGRGVAAAVVELGCESSPSSSTSRGRTCAREPPDGRVAAAPVRGVSGAHNERREATASATNRLRIVAAAKAASPPASLHHPRCAARLPRPRTPPPQNSRRIHRYPSPLHPCCDDYRWVRATGSPVAPPCPLIRACPPVSACISPGTDVSCSRGTTTSCLDGWSNDGPSDFRRTHRGPHTGPSTSEAAYSFTLQDVSIRMSRCYLSVGMAAVYTSRRSRCFEGGSLKQAHSTMIEFVPVISRRLWTRLTCTQTLLSICQRQRESSTPARCYAKRGIKWMVPVTGPPLNSGRLFLRWEGHFWNKRQVYVAQTAVDGW